MRLSVRVAFRRRNFENSLFLSLSFSLVRRLSGSRFLFSLLFLSSCDFVRTGVVETDEENEESSSETDDEYTPVKKKQRVDLINEERTGKRKRKETKKEKDEVIESALAKISTEDLKKAEKEAINLNFKKGNADYVALVVLLMGKAVGVTEMSATTITDLASKWSLGGKTSDGKKKIMGFDSIYSANTIYSAMKRDNTNFFRRNTKRDGKFFLADKMEEITKKKTTTEQEIEAFDTAVAKIGVEGKKVVLEEAKAEAKDLNFEEGNADYVALVVLLMGKAVGVAEMSATTITDLASKWSLGEETAGEKEKGMVFSTIRSALVRDSNTNIFRRNTKRDGKFFLADELEKITKRRRRRRTKKEMETKKKEKEAKKKEKEAKKKEKENEEGDGDEEEGEGGEEEVEGGEEEGEGDEVEGEGGEEEGEDDDDEEGGKR